MKISVVIVNYKVKYYLEQCLDSLYKALDGIDNEVFVVDNASGDDSIDFVRKRYPDAIYIENETNVGFSRGNNVALARCSGEYILLLNPDTIVPVSTIVGCIRFIDSHSNVGAVTVKMISSDGTFHQESKRGFPSPKAAFFKLTGLSKLFPKTKMFGGYNLLYLDENETHQIDIFCGAYIMLRKSLMDKVGMLDPSFFMYGEDIDFSYRLVHDTGYLNYYLPLPIIHYKGESTKKGSISYVRSFYGAMLIFYKKYYGSTRFLFQLVVKLGVYLHAAYHYLSQSLKRLLSARQQIESTGKKKRVVTVGLDDDDLQLLSSNGNSAGYVVVSNHDADFTFEELANKACDYVIFNRETISYDKMTDFINSHNPHKAELGVYSRDLKILVLSERIIHLSHGKNL